MTSESTSRLGGWLLLPLAWLILLMLSSALGLALFVSALFHPEVRDALSESHLFLLQWTASVVTSLLVWGYSVWVIWLYCKRSQRLPRHYIIWLLLTVVLAFISWAFTPIDNGSALRNLLMTLLAAAIGAPWFRRSAKVKATFVENC